MKSVSLKKLEKLVNRNPATISQWLRYREEYLTLKNSLVLPEIAPEFKLGHLMKVVFAADVVRHLSPSGMSHLFFAYSHRFPHIINLNSEKGKTGRGKWFTKTRGKHQIFVNSISVFSKNKLEWLVGPSDVVRKYILPNGFIWKKDEFGIFMVDSDGIDYHPYWTDDITVDNILSGHANNKEKRKIQIENEKSQKHINEIFQRDIKNTYVNLHDSQRAGNCIEGSLRFAEIKFGLSRYDILNGSHLMQINAQRLVATGEHRAINAIRCAWERETTISI